MRLLSRCANITPSKTIENEEIEKAIRKLKRNKAADIQGFRNEYVIYGGEEVKQTLLELLNEILQQQMIPNRWKGMRIKSIYKNKGDKRQMKNQRVFITKSLYHEYC